MSSNILALSLSLISSFLFALGVQFQNIGLSDVSSKRGTAISITSSAIMYWFLAPIFLDSSNFFNPIIFVFVLVGIFRPSLSANLAVSGTRFLGPTLSTTLSSTTPLFGAFLGVVWLGETYSWQLGVGTLGVIGTIILLSTRKKNILVDWPIWALTLPIGAAFIRSLAHVLTKIGMVDMPDPYFAGLISFSVSAVITNLYLCISTEKQSTNWHLKGTYWFALAGVTMGIAIIFLNTALMHANLTLVIPIVAISPLFTMLLSIFIFKREILTKQIYYSLLLVLPSIALITLTQ